MHSQSKQTADIIIVGGGVLGCSTAYNLAKHGARKVILLERKGLASGGTGKSCAILRTHYSIRANLIHAVKSLGIYENFSEAVGGAAGFRRTGYLILGPEEHREDMRTIFRIQNEYGVDTAELTPKQAQELHLLVRTDNVPVLGYDSLAGYCDPRLTTHSYAKRAQDLGVTLLTETAVTDLDTQGQNYRVHTSAGIFECPQLLLAAGPWTNGLGAMLGVEFPYVVSRHKVITLKTDLPYQAKWPIVKDLTTPDKIYCRPASGGSLLVGTGDHGDPIQDADTLTDEIEQLHADRIRKILARRMPAFESARLAAGWTGPYDITPDWNPILGAVPGHKGLSVAVGFSGHGFKLAPTLGESLAQTLLGLAPTIPIDMYGLERFQKGTVLEGVYGIGSIS